MIKLIKSTFYNESKTKNALCKFISGSKQLSFGKECEKFEQRFSQWQGRRECVLLNSGSSANLAIVQALLNMGRIKKGDYVGFSAVTWSTNIMPLIQLGLRPVPIDVSLETLNITSDTLLRVTKTHRLSMVFLTNLLGFCSDIDTITSICKAHDIVLVEDNCESLGTVYKGKKLGNFGLASTFSFYVGHHMSTIEGGAVCTDDEELALMLRLVRAHGWDRNLTFSKQEEMRKKYNVNSTFYSRYTFYDMGYNLRPTEITGFLGNVQLQYLDEIIRERQKNYHQLADAIYGQKDLYHPITSSHIDCISNFAFPVVCKTVAFRDALVKECDKKVEIRPIVGGNMIMQPFFKKYISYPFPVCPNASLIHNQGLYFGNNPELTSGEIQTLLKIFSP